MDDPEFYRLTPPDVMALRLTCRGLRATGGGVNMGAPFVLYLPADDTFCLHAYGSPQATSRRLDVLGACLRAERAESGFIRRILSADEPCDVATLAPDARARHASQIAAEASRARQEAADARDRIVRRASHIDPSKLSLDDL